MIPSHAPSKVLADSVYQRGWMIDSQPDHLVSEAANSISKGMDD